MLLNSGISVSNYVAENVLPAISSALPSQLDPSLIHLAGNLAPIASLALFLAPLPTIHKISQDQHVGSLSLLPYSSMATCAFVWTSYGLLNGQTTVWLSNGIGLVFALFYFVQFARFAPKEESSTSLPRSVKQHIEGSALIAGSTLVAVTTEHANEVIGIMAVALCLALFASPLAALKNVLASKSAESIPFPQSAATTINCLLWSTVGIFDLGDPFIAIPNSIGLLLGLLQLSLKFAYDYKGNVPGENNGSLNRTIGQQRKGLPSVPTL
mmetsp:Transcript_2138/g.2960  ORF Transcript_2138/g.2960 Transcript_2138/m.2960 type:complete len:269 (-) Transcript_2138:23-829(-)|eukprot:CAMPEP_0198139840 /NCGR_PEP_ID=MMETSP1443-20131203/3077_1 /TAXON_ID=186043 /ORGANISM="Entomoneis sp., Strain CCMP2396" /LENGTH=268 /DNA_ID=CAMNT_0043802089 /DNA_START=345 /DNA_END=1151 /DNA_ORIENTATION=-